MINALRLGCLAALIVSAIGGYSQDKKKAESSSYKVFKDRSSEGNIRQLLNDANKVKNSDAASALKLVEEALGMSLAGKDEFNEAKCYILLGEINEFIGEWKLALENYSRAYEKLKVSYEEHPEFDRSLMGMGTANSKLGNYTQAIDNYKQISTTNPKGGFTNPQEVKLALAEVYYQMGDYAKALESISTIDTSPKKIVGNSLNARVQNLQAKVYARTNELERSKSIYENTVQQTLADSTIITPEGAQSLQKAKEEIAGELRSQKRFDEEITLRTQSAQLNIAKKNIAEATKDMVEIGKSLDAKGEPLAALRELEEAVRMADTIDNPKEKANAFLTLADLYEKNGRNTQAIVAYKRYSKAMIDYEAKNQRTLQERSGLIKQQRDIEELTKDVSLGEREATIEQATMFRQQLIIYGLLALILVTVVTSFFIYKNAQASKVANQLLALKSLRSQMNPHFIFNALNSVNHFIAQQDERTANRFLSEFSQLMRLVLENSQQDLIPLSKEQEILALYLKLEHYRFRDKFDYTFEIDPSINMDSIEVPPMLIQPYIENAVWHGLRYRDEKGKLEVKMTLKGDVLEVDVNDNGIGRKRSAEIKTENQRKHNSTGLKNIAERLLIINKVYHTTYQVSVGDGPDGNGTRVQIHFPIHKSVHIL
jgi:tetratricopeptide (TPR) repeat protein